MRRICRLIYRLLVALTAISLGTFGIVYGYSRTSASDLVVAAVGIAVLGIAWWFGKRFTPNKAPSIWSLLALVFLFGIGFSLVENTFLAFILVGIFAIFGGIAFFLVGVAPHLLGVDPKTYEYGSNMFFDAILKSNDGNSQPASGKRST